MAKYLVQAVYTAEGLQGLFRDKASGRKNAVKRAVESLGGRLEAFYYSFGDHDAVLIVDVPDNETAAAIALTTSATGMVRVRTTPLLSIEETDTALAKGVEYRPPGK